MDDKLQGLVGRVASWFGASGSGSSGGGHGQHRASTNGRAVPDFLAQAEDPDKRRLGQGEGQQRGVSSTLNQRSSKARRNSMHLLVNADDRCTVQHCIQQRWCVLRMKRASLTWVLFTAHSGTLEEQWRKECLAFARVKKLDHVADMRIFYVVRLS